MSSIIRKKQQKNYLEVPNHFAQDFEISNSARGLLVSIMSYPEDWVLRKDELYKRFPKDKRTSVASDLKELETRGYFFEVKIRTGKKYAYRYFASMVAFTEDEKKECYEEAIVLIGKELQETDEREYIWDVDFQQFKLNSPKSTAIKEHINQKHNKQKTKDDEDQHPLKTIESLKAEILATIDVLGEDTYMMVAMRCIAKFYEGGINGKFKNYFMSAIQTEIARLKKQTSKPGKSSTPSKKKSTRTEQLPEWFDKKDEKQSVIDQEQLDREALEEQRRLLEEELKQYKK